ncbi:thermonuclease family protein [Methylorubrum sp. SL192]|uniref:thermonuclease family protein n=1 Tax=Methylorubrum sp. SL192 TaxID=2995167 RepID=UPI0022753595|nr:thermonuclease family protein [Methylorubrum sp. SL192]MCY1641011.1 thermonuclease family protein [Methylorubrum sp. SL192]
MHCGSASGCPRHSGLVAVLACGGLFHAGQAAERFDSVRLIVFDGDPAALPARGCAEKVRLRGIDTPDVSRLRCEAERIAGLRAKERLAHLIRGRAVELVRAGETDRFGRTFGTLRVPAGEVGAILLWEGLAVAYRPGRRA